VRRLVLITSVFSISAAAAAEPAAAWMPKPVEFEQRVALPHSAHAAGGWITTEPKRAAKRFDMVGVEWRGPQAVKIELRARSQSGRWTRWTEAGADADGPDPPEARATARRVGEPIWAGGSDRVQLRLSRPVRGLKVRLINTTGTATRHDRARTAARAARAGQPGTLPLPQTGADVPSIVPRSAWGGSLCKPRATPGFGRIQMAFVHHTVSLNNYSRSQSAAVVLAVCLFHTGGNGWNDMGYNFLVDRYGRVFEGRAGGIDQPVVGAHAGGFNVPSTGVSLIGDFSHSAPPAAAMSALARLLAWKLSIHGVPAQGRITVISAGGPSTSYRAGTPVTLQRISGHRDADITACAGAYRLLPALRRRVAALEGPLSALTLSASATSVPYGTGLTVAGVLTLPDGQPGAGEVVEVRSLAGGKETAVASAITAPDGTWSAAVPAPARYSVLRAVFAGDGGDRPGVISPVAAVDVVPAIGLSAEQPSVPAGRSVVVDGTVSPPKRRVTIVAYRVLADGRLKRAATRRVRVSRGAFRAGIRLARAGTYRLVARVPADSATGAGSSAPVEVTAASQAAVGKLQPSR
jgi:hypothetical protein